MNEQANASMVTLESVGIRTPDAVEGGGAEKQLGAIPAFVGGEKVEDEKKKEGDGGRPAAERFYTAGAGAGLFSSGAPPEAVGEDKAVERPGVERFETAMEDLNTLAAGVDRK